MGCRCRRLRLETTWSAGAIEDRLDELRGQDNWTKQEKAEFEALRDELAGMAGQRNTVATYPVAPTTAGAC